MFEYPSELKKKSIKVALNIAILKELMLKTKMFFFGHFEGVPPINILKSYSPITIKKWNNLIYL